MYGFIYKNMVLYIKVWSLAVSAAGTGIQSVPSAGADWISSISSGVNWYSWKWAWRRAGLLAMSAVWIQGRYRASWPCEFSSTVPCWVWYCLAHWCPRLASTCCNWWYWPRRMSQLALRMPLLKWPVWSKEAWTCWLTGPGRIPHMVPWA